MEALKVEVQMLVPALGKYKLFGLSKEDIGALDKKTYRNVRDRVRLQALITKNL